MGVEVRSHWKSTITSPLNSRQCESAGSNRMAVAEALWQVPIALRVPPELSVSHFDDSRYFSPSPPSTAAPGTAASSPAIRHCCAPPPRRAASCGPPKPKSVTTRRPASAASTSRARPYSARPGRPWIKYSSMPSAPGRRGGPPCTTVRKPVHISANTANTKPLEEVVQEASQEIMQMCDGDSPGIRNHKITTFELQHGIAAHPKYNGFFDWFTKNRRARAQLDRDRSGDTNMCELVAAVGQWLSQCPAQLLVLQELSSTSHAASSGHSLTKLELASLGHASKSSKSSGCWCNLDGWIDEECEYMWAAQGTNWLKNQTRKLLNDDQDPLKKSVVDQMFKACMDGDVAKLRHSIDAAGERAAELVNQVDSKGSSGLIHVAWHGSLPCAQLLISAGAGVNVRNTRKNSALHFCYERGNIPMSHLLLKRGAGLSLLFRNTLCKKPRDLLAPSSAPPKRRLLRNGVFLSSQEEAALQDRVRRAIPKAPRKCRVIVTGASRHPDPQDMHYLSSLNLLTPLLSHQETRVGRADWVMMQPGR